ncbi:MAG: hypothetical protein PHN74_03515 [Candidatus Pacebacteria bacterium]|nr:hypothetical protein [Candidatus Paceibacterota bacterium]
MIEGPRSKISTAEFLIVLQLFLINDIIGIVLICFALDDFFLLDVIRFPLSQLYLRIKGIKGLAMLVGNILETIPYVGALPNATIAWLVITWLDHHPKVEAAFGTVAKKSVIGKTPKTEGGSMDGSDGGEFAGAQTGMEEGMKM